MYELKPSRLYYKINTYVLFMKGLISMNTAKKALALLMSLLIVLLIVPVTAVSVSVAEYNITSYEELLTAVNNCSGSDQIHLGKNIALPSGDSSSNITLTNKTYNLYLDGYTLDLGDNSIICEGKLNIYGGSSDKGGIIADNTVIILQKNTPALTASSGVTITSRNGNAILSKVTTNLTTSIEGATVKAPNGSAYFAGGYGASLTLQGGKLEGKYGITVDLSQAPSVGSRIKYSNYTYINLIGGTIDASEKVLNNNTSDIGNSYTSNFNSIVRYYVKSGYFSEDIFEANTDISWRNSEGTVINSFPPVRFYNGYYAIIPEIHTETDFDGACAEGGTYSLANDISFTSAKSPKYDISIIGNGNTIQAENNNANLFVVNDLNFASISLDNVVLDGNNTARRAYINNSSQTSGNKIFTLTNSTVKNFKPGDLYGAVITKSSQSLELNNVSIKDNTVPVRENEVCAICYIDENCTASIKNCDIDGEILNRGTLTVEGGEYTAPDGKAVVYNAESASLTVKDGVFSNELFDYVPADKFMLRVQDNTSDGKYIVQDDYSGSADVEETNRFELKNITSYKNVQILGVQKKHNISDVDINAQEKNADGTTSENSIRFITTVNEGIVKGANVEDYGYVAAKIPNKQPSEIYASNVFNALKYNGANGEKTLSCKNTKNNVVQNSGYGDPSNSDTTYKYVTLAVNNIDDGASVIARFYVKTKDGKTYYGDYVKGGEILPGIAASMEALN